jgi:shikimate kinase
MMGSGKSTLGYELSEMLNAPFYDLDELIESGTGMTIRQIFETSGETTFRRIEYQMLKDIMLQKEFGVIATGGGTVLSAENRRIMRSQGYIVWLYCRPSVLISRLSDSIKERPMLTQDNWQAELVDIYRMRYPAYLQCHFQVRNEVDSRHSTREIIASLDH